ncbi:hypothetical protein ABG768_026235 [Culter alburnus]|uniref:Macro domain-containing protein n=1 Tax=Culter alburnus TaxID=194366 RepID=A0AAW2A988_CULAL
MVTIDLVPEDTGGKLEWVNSTQCRCGYGQIPWEEVRTAASVVNIRQREGAEVPPFIYSNSGGKDGFPKVRLFDENGSQVRNVPTRSWTDLTPNDLEDESERGSVALSFVPHRDENEDALDPSAPVIENPESPSEESSEEEESLRIYFGKGTNLIILREGRLEQEEECDLIVNPTNKLLKHDTGVSAALKGRAGRVFQDESNKLLQNRPNPLFTGDVILQKQGGPNGKPVLHVVGQGKGKGIELEEQLRAVMVTDIILDKICAVARENKYRSVAMPIILGEEFGFDEIETGTSLVTELLRKTHQTDWPKMWMICHPNPAVLKNITKAVNNDRKTGERGSEQEVRPKAKTSKLRADAPEYVPDPQWPILRRVKTSRGKKEQVENPFPKLRLGESYETFRIGQGSYRPTHAKSRKKDTLLVKEDLWDEQYAPGITCGQVWSLLNGGDAVEILADTTLTRRAKRAILAQKDLTNKAALEKIIRSTVGNERYDEYYSDTAAESDDINSGSDSEDQEESEEEERVVASRESVPTPVRRPATPRRLRFRERTVESDDQPDSDVDPPAGVSELNQHLEALHLGTPGQRPKTINNDQRRPQLAVEASIVRPKATLEELMQRDQEMKMLKKAKLKNTTVKGKLRELVRYGEQMRISGESIDSHILAEFGIHGGRKLAQTLEGLIPTDKEEVDQKQFEEKWLAVGSLSACQEVAERGVEGILKLIFRGVKRGALVGAREFLLYGPETLPEELERALIRYDRKTELIQADREKAQNKPAKSKDQNRRSGRDRKPYNRHETESKPPSHPERRINHKGKPGADRGRRVSPKNQPYENNRYREQSRPRMNKSENKEKSTYISPEKWAKMSQDERAQAVAERGKNKPSAKIGMNKVVETRVEVEEVKPKKVKRKRKKAEEIDE